MHTRSAGTGLILITAALIATPHSARAEDFVVANGDPQNLIDAINAANANGEPDRIFCDEYNFRIAEVDNMTDGPNGLPSITSNIEIRGYYTQVQRSAESGTPPLRLFHVSESGTLRLTELTISNGHADLGGAVFNRGTLILEPGPESDGVYVLDNYAENSGGGIYNAPGATLMAEETQFWSNHTNGDGGFLANFGTATLQQCQIWDNVAGVTGPDGRGGAIFNAAELTVERATMAGNIASSLGGGLHTSGNCLLVNSTVSGNTAGDAGGGLLDDGGTCAVVQCTIAENAGAVGAGVRAHATDSVLSLNNTIVANSLGVDCDGATAVIDNGFNLIADATCLTTATSLSGDPLLGPLAANGYPTNYILTRSRPATHELLPGSIARNAGDCAEGSQSMDQRGFDRPRAGACDIGAFEACQFDPQIPDGDGDALFHAITCAEETLSAEVIELAENGTYLLTNENLPSLHTTVVINANGSLLQRVRDPNETASFFSVSGHAEWTVNDARLTGANQVAYAGWRGHVTLNRCELFENDTTWRTLVSAGGSNLAEVTLNDCLIRDNVGDGLTSGRVRVHNSVIRGNSAGISSGLGVSDSVIDGNAGTGYYGGGPITNTVIINNTGDYGVELRGEATIEDCLIGNNQQGVYVFTDRPCVIRRCQIVDNASYGIQNYRNAEVHVEQCEIAGNATAVLNRRTVAALGGTMIIRDSEIHGNTGGFSGVIDNGFEMTIRNTAIHGNGQAIWNRPSSEGSLAVTNSTISGNLHGIRNWGPLSLRNVTLTGNGGGPAGGGITNADGALATVTNSILAGNPDGDCAGETPIMDLGHNIIGDAACITDPTSFAADPLLGPLADNGGLTPTHALLPGSPAIDAGDCGEVNDDQRGVARPRGRACDIGAVEAPCAGDITGDGQVDMLDLAELLQQFGRAGDSRSGDLNADGRVNLTDLAIVLAGTGQPC